MHRLWTALFCSVIFLVFLIGISAPSKAQVGATTLASTVMILNELRNTLQSSLNTVSAESQARINQLTIAIDVAIKQVNDAIDKTANHVKYNETKLFTDIFNTLSDVNNEISSKGYITFIGVNATLVNAATLLDGLPFVDIKPFLFATYPMRLRPDADDTLVSIYGFFRSVDDAHTASVTYQAAGGGPETTNALSKYVGGSLAFKLPKSALKEGTFIDLTINIPQKKFYFFNSEVIFKTRVYVERLNALTLKISTYQENPAKWATVVSPTEHQERADSNRTSNNASASAPQLFSILVNNNADYEASTATFSAMGSRLAVSGRPCWCNCSSPSGRLVSWDANAVTWNLHAPSCGPTVCTTTSGGFIPVPQVQACGGGGTNANIYLKPTFRVKARNQPDDTLVNEETILLKRRDVWQSKPLPASWDNVSVIGEFKDGDETHRCQFNIPKGVPNGTCPLFSGAIASNVLTIQSR